MSQQLAAHDSELAALRAELQSKNQALEKAQAFRSDAQKATLMHGEDVESAKVLHEQALAQQIEQNQADLAASQEQCRQLLQRLQDLEQQLTEQLAANPPDYLSSHQPELQHMTHQLEEAQAEISKLECAQQGLTQQLREANLQISEHGQTEDNWRSLAVYSSQLIFAVCEKAEADTAAAQPLCTMERVVREMHDKVEEAQTAVKELTQQLQVAAAAHAHETEQLRYVKGMCLGPHAFEHKAALNLES